VKPSPVNTYFGGKGANQAVAIGKLDYPVKMLANVGSDSFGSQLREALPEVGTMEDFRASVRLIDSKGMAVISFDNLGYCSSEAPEFLKAADDVTLLSPLPEPPKGKLAQAMFASVGAIPGIESAVWPAEPRLGTVPQDEGGTSGLLQQQRTTKHSNQRRRQVLLLPAYR
jgi:hypothetical protein